MAYSEELAERIRFSMAKYTAVSERKMFGGLCFMYYGNMCVGVLDNILVLRLGEERAEVALKEPHTKIMDFTGKPMKGFVYVYPEGMKTPTELQQWVDRAVEFCETLPRKG